MLKVYYKYIRNAKAKFSPTYLILILMTSNPTVINFPLLVGRFLFKIKSQLSVSLNHTYLLLGLILPFLTF